MQFANRDASLPREEAVETCILGHDHFSIEAAADCDNAIAEGRGAADCMHEPPCVSDKCLLDVLFDGEKAAQKLS